MGRGGASAGGDAGSPVPLLRARGPMGGFAHKILNATSNGKAFSAIQRSPNAERDIGARNRRGRANVGVSNRRTAKVTTEIINSTGKVALNTDAIQRASPEKMQARLPGLRPSPVPDLTEALRFAQAEVSRSELAGGMATTKAHPPGDATKEVTLQKPQAVPTSGRGRMGNEDRSNPAAGTIQPLNQTIKQETMKLRKPGSPMYQEQPEAVVDQARCTSVPPGLGRESPVFRRTQANLARAKSTAAQPELPAFRHNIKDADHTVKLQKKPKGMSGMRFKYDRIYYPPFRAGNKKQESPFANGFQAITKCPKQSLQKPEPKDPKRAAQNIVIDLASKVLARVNVRKTFRDFDADRSGDLDYEEFRNGLQMLGFRVTDAEFTEVMKILDRDGDGTIAYEEFCTKLGNTTMYDNNFDENAPDDEERNRALLESVWKRVDADESGTLDRDEVRQVLCLMGFENTGEKVLDHVMLELDQDGSGDVDFEEFGEWFLKQDIAKQAAVPPTPRYKGVADDGELDDNRSEWGEDEDTEEDKDPLLDTSASWSRERQTGGEPASTSPSLRATIHSGHFESVRVAKSMSTGDIDFRWKVPRSPEQKAATVFHVPALEVKYTTGAASSSLGDLGHTMKDKVTTIAKAFTNLDEERSGEVDKRMFRDTLYKLNMAMTETQVDRVFAALDRDNKGAIDYSEFCDDIEGKQHNRHVYADIMETATGRLPVVHRAAAALLPKNAVEPLVTHPEKPKLWHSWDSPSSMSTIHQHLKATGPESPFFITKDGRSPGSKLDFYERGTGWVDRHQKGEKKVHDQRSRARGERTMKHQERCKETYYKSKRATDEKIARRTATFRVQQQRYEGSIRRSEQYANPVLSDTIGFDMSSDMHCPRTRVSPRKDMLTQGRHLYKSMMLDEGHAEPHEALMSSPVHA